MTLDRDRADSLLAGLDVAMVVVTAEVDGERSGCLVGFHSQCSIEPLRYAVWISRENHTFGVARRAELMSLHLLGAGDGELAAVFGSTTGDELDKWRLLDLADLALDVPRLLCRRVAVLDDGVCDHVCFVLEPISVEEGRAADDAGTGADTAADIAPLRFGTVKHLRPGHGA